MANAEIQVGEYVRTENGYIGKVTEILSGAVAPRVQTELKAVSTIMVINHSFNLIDLIEAGDYVNGYLVEAIDYYEDENGNLFDVLGVVFTDDDFAYSKELKNINIYSIVTKEQFKSMQYEVGEDD